MMEAIRYLMHFYSNKEFLFQTVTMYGDDEREMVFDSIVSTKSWYWGRFSATDRTAYMARRVAVEKMLFSEFEDSHWRLRNEHPVYLYLIPNLSLEETESDLGNRKEHQENHTEYLLFDLERISSRSNITFTLDDSLRSYRRKLLDQGIPCRELTGKCAELSDYGQIFHIDELADVYERNAGTPDIRFEIQVWDKDILMEYMEAKQSG
jgi:hypothetical protein